LRRCRDLRQCDLSRRHGTILSDEWRRGDGHSATEFCIGGQLPLGEKAAGKSNADIASEELTSIWGKYCHVESLMFL